MDSCGTVCYNEVMVKTNNSITLITVVMVLFVFCFGFSLVGDNSASAISKACQNSAACREAVAEEEAANKAASDASANASAFQIKVNELTAAIAAKKLEIAETEAQVADLNKQIEKTEAILLDEQEALVELLVNMHFEDDAEPITVLAGSTSISDLAEKAAREEVVKQQISTAAQKVKETKVKLEEDKNAVEELLAQQKAAQTELSATKTEQEALVEKYKNDASAYEEVAAAAREAQWAAEQEEQQAHPELYGGSSFTGYNTYPYQDRCPAERDTFYAYGGYSCECTSYAGWKAYEYAGVTISYWGNAYSWASSARARGYEVSKTPAANSIGQSSSGVYGHVFWVESVNADGSINVTEYNNWYATGLYSGIYQTHDFGARTIGAGEVWQYNYIILE